MLGTLIPWSKINVLLIPLHLSRLITRMVHYVVELAVQGATGCSHFHGPTLERGTNYFSFLITTFGFQWLFCIMAVDRERDFLDYCEGYILLALSTKYWETMYARTTSSLHFERRHEQLAHGVTGCGVLKEKLSRINLTSNMWDPVWWENKRDGWYSNGPQTNEIVNQTSIWHQNSYAN